MVWKFFLWSQVRASKPEMQFTVNTCTSIEYLHFENSDLGSELEFGNFGPSYALSGVKGMLTG
jgi:hypothetical protein